LPLRNQRVVLVSALVVSTMVVLARRGDGSLGITTGSLEVRIERFRLVVIVLGKLLEALLFVQTLYGRCMIDIHGIADFWVSSRTQEHHFVTKSCGRYYQMLEAVVWSSTGNNPLVFVRP
jgi:hypothetical protein